MTEDESGSTVPMFLNSVFTCYSSHTSSGVPKESDGGGYGSYIDYFMESARVRYLRTSCWRIRKRTSERSERVSLLIQKQRVRKYRTKHFPCCNSFILYLLRFFNPNQIFTLH